MLNSSQEPLKCLLDWFKKMNEVLSKYCSRCVSGSWLISFLPFTHVFFFICSKILNIAAGSLTCQSFTIKAKEINCFHSFKQLLFAFHRSSLVHPFRLVSVLKQGDIQTTYNISLIYWKPLTSRCARRSYFTSNRVISISTFE